MENSRRRRFRSSSPPEIPAKRFFGQHLNCRQQYAVEERVELALKNKWKIPKQLLHPYKARLLDESNSGVWRVFGKQQEAFEFLKRNCDDSSRVFVCECCSTGRRTYVVTGVERFWHDYSMVEPEKRHFYELILENRPCRLYFDIEFHRAENPHLDGFEVLSTFLKFVGENLREAFGVELNYDDYVDLNSSTAEKFSRHIIAHIPNNRLFSNNRSCGLFVKSLCDKLRDNLSLDEENKQKSLELLMVTSKRGTKVPLCDEAVYSKNRQFRLYLSTKFGKTSFLRLSEECRFYPDGFKPNEKAVFLDGLVVPKCGRRKISNCLNFPPCKNIFPTLSSSNETTTSTTQITTTTTTMTIGTTRDANDGPSPFPNVDTALLANVRLHCKTRPFIRSSSYFRTKQFILYEIGNCRYCYNIEREHKSNHVIWIADLNKRICYQKCYDPECRAVDFRSNDFPLFVVQNNNSVEENSCEEEDFVSDENFALAIERLESEGLIP